MKNFLINNWKTNIIAVLVLVIIGFYVFDLINTEQLVTIQGFLIASGLFLSKEIKTNNSLDIPEEDKD